MGTLYTIFIRKKVLEFELDLHEHQSLHRLKHECDVVECEDVGFCKPLNPLTVSTNGRPEEYTQEDADQLIGACVLRIARQSATESFEIKIDHFGTTMCAEELDKQWAARALKKKQEREKQLLKMIRKAQAELEKL